VKNPVVPHGASSKKKPFRPFIPVLPYGAFWLFHVKREREEAILAFSREGAGIAFRVMSAARKNPANLSTKRLQNYHLTSFIAGHKLETTCLVLAATPGAC